MTSETSRPQPDSRPAPGRLTDAFDADRWRSPIAGVVVGALTVPALGLLLAALLVLAVQGEATWLYVVGAALVLSVLGVVGTVVALRSGHPGVVQRLSVLTWVWSGIVVLAGIAVALQLDVPERIGVSVLLVLGGAYGVVVGLALWGASRVMPLPEPASLPEADPAEPPVSRPTDSGLADLVDGADVAGEVPPTGARAGDDEPSARTAGLGGAATTSGLAAAGAGAGATAQGADVADDDELDGSSTTWPAWGAAGTDPRTTATGGAGEPASPAARSVGGPTTDDPTADVTTAGDRAPGTTTDDVEVPATATGATSTGTGATDVSSGRAAIDAARTDVSSTDATATGTTAAVTTGADATGDPGDRTASRAGAAGPAADDDDVVVTEVLLVDEILDEGEPVVTDVLVVEEVAGTTEADRPAADDAPPATRVTGAPDRKGSGDATAEPARKPRRTAPRGARNAPPQDEHPTTRQPAVGAGGPAASSGDTPAATPRRTSSSGAAGGRAPAEGRRPVRRSTRPAAQPRDGEEGPPTERLPPARR